MSNPLTLQDWLARIEGLHPRDIELGLDRVRSVAGRLELDFKAIDIVVVAGTNGKGSTVAALQAILLKHGLSVAAYTSPHLLKFNERIQVDGLPVTDELLCSALSEVERARQSTPLTYFEFTTLAALYCFSRYQPHTCLLEVGLGGRLDAVNIVDADLTVVTNIQLDHEAWLGNDREAIAREKAGVFRAGVPAICAERHPPPNLATIARSVGAQWLQLGQDFSLQERDQQWCWRGHDRAGRDFSVAGRGELRLSSEALAAAIQAACLLLQEPQRELTAMAVESLSLTGRCQFLHTERGTIILDVAHNPAAAQRLATRLLQAEIAGKTHVLFAMLEDKRGDAFAAVLKPVVDGQWWLPQLQTARARPAAKLAKDIESVRSRILPNVDLALEQALAELAEGDRLVVTGSFYTVAEVLQLLTGRGINLE